MSPKITTDERVRLVSAFQDQLLFQLMDGRVLMVPLAWYPRLQSASPDQLSRWEINGAGFVVRWPELDEDLEISGLLAGRPAPGLRNSGELQGSQIREYREAVGISQAELAEQLGVRQATVSDWEKGKSTPSRLAVPRLQELIRKHELSKTPSPSFSSTRWIETDPLCYAQGRWLMDEAPEGTLVGEYRFTELGTAVPASEPQPLLACARFNPSRQFLYSCSILPTK